jgi:isopentenyl diphosphate isomerase/L-lactate dehydrogenase-like FMN-dependent dehydrogenase
MHSPEASPEQRRRDRRAFLRFLASSPYIAALGGVRAAAFQTQQNSEVITDPKDALDVMDFEEAARRKVGNGHWAYMISGVDDDLTIKANREGFRHVQLRPRRLFDATKVDMKTEWWGTAYNSPIFLCPTGGEKSFWADAERAVARAAKARNTLQVLSSTTSTGVEDVNAARTQPVWYQLYAPNSWAVTEKLIHRVQDSGCPVVALTVDNTTGRNSQTYKRLRPKNLQVCASCHEGEPGQSIKERPMYDGIDMTGVSTQNPAMDWAFVDKLRKLVTVKLMIKGIDTREDARMALEHGFDGVWVSNHGGRSTETGRATIEALPEVVAEVGTRIPVFVDGGFRRGTDVFKALALGAKAVGIGRPFLWGLGAFGQAGVDRVLEIMQGELKLVMGNCGTQSVAKITRAHVATPDWHV